MAADIATQLEGAVESLGRFKDSLDDNNIRLGNSASIEAKINKLEVDKLKLLEKANKAEGKRMKDLASGMGKAAKSMGSLAMKLGVVGGILTMFKGVVDVLLKVDRHAAKFAKQMGATRGQTDRLLKSAMSVESSFTVWGSNLAEAVKTAGALAQEFGQISRVSKDMIAFTGKFSEAFALGTQSSAQFVEHIVRAGESFKEFVNKTQAQALISGNNLGVVFRDLAKNAGMVELYLTRGDDSIINMANRAASLGKSLESFGKMADAWSDVESIGENIGKTSQLLGSSFEDGLGSLTDLYKMYQNFQDDKLHEKITVQLAKTMEMENGILISKKTGLALTRAQVQQAAKLYGGDTEFMLRSIKYEKDFQAFQNSKITLGKDYNDITKDEFGALNDAAREMAKKNKIMAKDGKNTADLLNVQGKERAKLLELAEKEVAKRKEAAEKELDLEKILTSALGVLGKIQAMVATIFEPFTTAISSIFTDAFLDDTVNPFLEDMGQRIKTIFSGEEGGAFDLNAVGNEIKSPTGGIMSGIKVLSGQIKTNVMKAFSLETVNPKDVTKSPTWSMIWDDMMKSASESLRRGLIDAFSLQDEAGKALDPLNTTLGDVMMNAAGKLIDEIINQITLKSTQIATALSNVIEQTADKSGGILGWMFGSGGSEIMDESGRIKPQYSRQGGAMGAPKATGWAGGRHRAIVGEAGTEVGITRSALRELSSAGIPGYFEGFTAPGGTNQASGSYGARNQRESDNQSVGNAYRQTQGRFLDGLWRNQYNFLEEQDKREASFFIKYPAIVDEAIGRPFRESGPLATGIYNSIFSGMQAGARAEFAGASAERQREIAWQHSVAEGLKEGGIINQGLDKLAAISTKILDNGIEVTRNDVASLGVLGGIQHGMHAMALSIGRGGSKGQALEMGKRGAIGGIVQGLTSSFGGQADEGFLQQMDMMGYITGTKKLPTGTGRSTGDMLTAALNRTEATFQSQGRGLNWAGANAQGRVYNSPHLAMVGEGSQNEIIVPTERIRKGLPINAGVARELGSIGVPGYEVGKLLPKPDMSLVDVPKLGTHEGLVGWNMMHQGGAAFGGSRGAASISNIKGSAGNSLATAGLQFANTYMETGDAGRATGQAFGAGLGMAATAGLTPFLGPFAPLVGGMIGSFAGNALGNAFGYKPRHKKYRNRAMKLLESHARTGGRWDHGSPGGAQDAVMKALSGGKKKHPSEAAFEAMEGAVRGSSVLGGPVGRGGGVGPFLALLSGQVGDTGQENAMYARYNNAFTGNPLAMAKGGVVTRPTNAIIGEAGPEAVIPLNSMSDYSGIDQKKDNKNMIDELRKSNAQMQMFIKKIGDAKTVLNVDGRKLAETVGEGMWDINNGQ